MNRHDAIRWWPLLALLAMVGLGLAVGKGSTRVDDWFAGVGESHAYLGRLLFFTDSLVMLSVLLASLTMALYRRRWRLAAAVVLTPAVAIATERLLKRLFGREKGGDLAYPSGHTTLLVVVLGLAVLVVGITAWSVVLAITCGVLGIVGQGVTYHYFTDTIGAVLLGMALLWLPAALIKLDRCQPRVRSASQ